MSPFQLAHSATEPPTPWSYWIIPQLFLAGPFPFSRDDEEGKEKLQDILGTGVRAFVDLTEESETDLAGRPLTKYFPLAVSINPVCQHHRFEVVDGSVPTRERMLEILDTIDILLEGKQPVYVHCWGGVGRTGTVVACWLLRHGFASPETVLPMLAEIRKQDRHRGTRWSPETPRQREFVLSWNEMTVSA